MAGDDSCRHDPLVLLRRQITFVGEGFEDGYFSLEFRIGAFPFSGKSGLGQFKAENRAGEMGKADRDANRNLAFPDGVLPENRIRVECPSPADFQGSGEGGLFLCDSGECFLPEQRFRKRRPGKPFQIVRIDGQQTAFQFRELRQEIFNRILCVDVEQRDNGAFSRHGEKSDRRRTQNAQNPARGDPRRVVEPGITGSGSQTSGIVSDNTRTAGTLCDQWQEQFTSFMNQDEIRVIKQTKRSEKEVDIRPLIYEWEFRGDSVYVRTAAGSAQNLKPELIMDSFLKYAEYPSADTDSLNAGSFVYRRLEMYADAGKDGNRELVTLESLGREIRGEIN